MREMGKKRGHSQRQTDSCHLIFRLFIISPRCPLPIVDEYCLVYTEDLIKRPQPKLYP